MLLFCLHRFGGDDIYFGLVYVSHSGLNVYVTPEAVCKKGMNQALHFPLFMERLHTTCNDVKNSRNVRSRGTSLNKSCALSSLCWSPARQSYVWGKVIMSRKLLYHSAASVPREKPIKVKFSLSTPWSHVAVEEVSLYSRLTTAEGGGGRLASRPGRFIRGKEP